MQYLKWLQEPIISNQIGRISYGTDMLRNWMAGMVLLTLFGSTQNGLASHSTGMPIKSIDCGDLTPGVLLNPRAEAASQPGLCCTHQVSTDLANWISANTFLASSVILSWMGAASQEADKQFSPAKFNAPNPVTMTNYNLWANVVVLNNGLVEAVVVPAAGRILQFRLKGSANGPFWENHNLFRATAAARRWNTKGDFGGDKAWPSPQSDCGWPPPSGFDGSPNKYAFSNGTVTLTTAVDSTYNIRTTRIIELASDQPGMRIKTIFERTVATFLTSRNLGVWVITQAQDPVRAYVLVPSPPIFTNGFRLWDNDIVTTLKFNICNSQ